MGLKAWSSTTNKKFWSSLAFYVCSLSRAISISIYYYCSTKNQFWVTLLFNLIAIAVKVVGGSWKDKFIQEEANDWSRRVLEIEIYILSGHVLNQEYTLKNKWYSLGFSFMTHWWVWLQVSLLLLMFENM